MIPLLINLKGKEVLVFGGGKIATRRIKALLKEEALVTCISLELSEDLKSLASDHLSIQQKKYESSDLEKMILVIAATNNKDINERIKKECERREILCSRSDCHEDSDVIFPCVIRRGRLTLSVCTEGASPSLTKEIVKSLSEQYDESYIERLELLSSLRTKILKDENNESKELLNQIPRWSLDELREKLKEIDWLEKAKTMIK